MMVAGLHVRKPFAASFTALLLVSAYVGLSTSKLPQYGQSDKGLHFLTFLLLTVTFYWMVELPRRRCIHLTLVCCTGGLAIGCEAVQGVVGEGRRFDPYDVLANVVGSTCALVLCSWYHRRMLERKRKNKAYDLLRGAEGAGDEPGDGDGDGDGDVELGEGPGPGRAQDGGGTAPAEPSPHAQQPPAAAASTTNVTEELDHWDENEEDWDQALAEAATATAAGAAAGEEPPTRRTD